MPAQDPYFRTIPVPGCQFVIASRPITLVQEGSDADGIVHVAADQDLVVYADSVTIHGVLKLQAAAADTTGVGGKKVVIVARLLDSIPASDTSATIDLSGGQGPSPTAPIEYVNAAGIGSTGSQGLGPCNVGDEPGWDAGRGGLGATGGAGLPGGPGGTGGEFDLRCGSLTDTAALQAVVGGGKGGTGTVGQQGGQGGTGGPGKDAGDKCADGFFWQHRLATTGGPGGPGGTGGAGGPGGAGGAPGTVHVALRSGSVTGLGTSLLAGLPGDPGDGGAAGLAGQGGLGGLPMDAGIEGRADSGGVGTVGVPGVTPKQADRAGPGAALVVTSCAGVDLSTGLPQPLTGQTAMLLDQIRADFLAATGTAHSDDVSECADRLDWESALLSSYTPRAVSEEDDLDAQRSQAQTLSERLSAGLDFYGNAASFAPLGTMESYQETFADVLVTLGDVQQACDAQVDALDQATCTAMDVDAARKALTSQQASYDQGVTDLRKQIATLVTRIAGGDSDAVDAQQRLLNAAVEEFTDAVEQTIGLSPEDLIEALGQFAFFGEGGFQQGAMIASQGLKLLETASSTCLADDGTKVDKNLVIDKLHAVTDLETSLSYAGTVDGVRLDDPGAVKLLGEQSQLDDLCTKFWSYKGAATTKASFDDFVSAVQSRNADIVTLNESLARLRAYLSGQAQTAAVLAKATDQAGKASIPGATALMDQLTRMTVRAREDAIEQLYLASRAYSFWSLQADDKLAVELTDLGVGEPLALTPQALESVGSELLVAYRNDVAKRAVDRNKPFPQPQDGSKARGILVELTQESHPAMIDALRTSGVAKFHLTPPRAKTPESDSPFYGLSDVRISTVRCWVDGITWGATSTGPGGPNLRVDLLHSGRDTLISPDDQILVFTHDPVHAWMLYDSTRSGDPDGIVSDGTIAQVADDAIIGPFARWEVEVSKQYNTGVDWSGITKVTLEFLGQSRSFGMPIAGRS